MKFCEKCDYYTWTKNNSNFCMFRGKKVRENETCSSYTSNRFKYAHIFKNFIVENNMYNAIYSPIYFDKQNLKVLNLNDMLNLINYWAKFYKMD